MRAYISKIIILWTTPISPPSFLQKIFRGFGFTLTHERLVSNKWSYILKQSCSFAVLFKYIWPFSWHQALKSLCNVFLYLPTGKIQKFWNFYIRGEWHINFCTLCVIMTQITWLPIPYILLCVISSFLTKLIVFEEPLNLHIIVD